MQEVSIFLWDGSWSEQINCGISWRIEDIWVNKQLTSMMGWSCCCYLMPWYGSLVWKLWRLRKGPFHLLLHMLKTFLLGTLLLLIIVMMGRWGIWLTWCRLTTIDQASWRVASKLMILMTILLSFSLWRSTSGVRIVGWLLTDGFMIGYVRSSTAIARHLLWPHSYLSSLGLYRPSFTFDLVEALLAILLISILNGLHYGVLICDHTLT